jgi:hypothetical protein
MTSNMWRKAGISMAAVMALAAAGCGGGGGSDSASQNDGNGNGDGNGTNAPPSIQGQPSSAIVAGQQYSFQPSASDPNGDALTFSVANLPAWATFSQSTGRVAGTPASADVGTYSNITISVSDGTSTASLAAFAIAVTDVATGSATLSWTPPTSNVDGSTLSDLAGYEIRYGRSATGLDQTVSLTNPSLSTYVLENLSGGTWYFALAAVNSQGTRSSLSNVASKTIS